MLTRNSAARVNALLEVFPAVLILGVRQSGKTTLAKQVRPDWKYFDLENIDDYEFISSDIGFFFKEYPGNIIIDEAQESAELFRHLRRVIDSNRNRKNRFILTGSSSPELIRQASDSLAGRLGVVELGTLKMNELHEEPLPAFYEIFDNRLSTSTIDKLKQLIAGDGDVIDDFLHGGYPEPVLANSSDFFQTWMQNYFQLYIERDVRKLFPKLDSIKYRRFVSTLSELSGTIINKAQLGRSLDTSEVTIRDYLEIADKTFVWRMIPSYEKTKSKSIVKMPKGILRDAGLAHFLANIDDREKLIRSPNVGQNFESFIIEEILKGVQCTRATNWSYYYYRTKHGAEVDLILEGSFGILPVEIKFGISTKSSQIASLKRFLSDNSLPLGVVINNSTEVKALANDIIQIPASLI
jgi:predicted AAA+ superfamily ATPase